MTTLYVSSVAGDNTDGTTWAKAFTTVAGALAVLTGTGPHVVYVDSAHSFTSGAAIAWNVAVAAQLVAIISVDRNGSVTTGHNGRLAGASETVGINAAAFSVLTTTTGNMSLYGLVLTSNSGTSGVNDIVLCTANQAVVLLAQDCSFNIAGNQADQNIHIGHAQNSAGPQPRIKLQDCSVQLSNNASAAAAISLQNAELEICGAFTVTLQASKPVALFKWLAASTGNYRIINSDWSSYNVASSSYFTITNFTGGKLELVNCKLSATPGLTTGTWSESNAASITLVNVDSGDTHNVFEHRTRLGTVTENASQYRNNGAQFDGSGISWEIVTTASCNEQEPFVTPWIHRWLTTTGALTFDLELIRDSATDYTDREVWGEFEVLESASFPNGTLTSTRNAAPFDGSAVDLTNSAEAWTESLTNDNEMRVRVTRTAAEKSLIRARLSVGVASTTLYLDPVIAIQGQANNPPTRWTVEGAVNVEPAAGGGGGYVIGGN